MPPPGYNLFYIKVLTDKMNLERTSRLIGETLFRCYQQVAAGGHKGSPYSANPVAATFFGGERPVTGGNTYHKAPGRYYW